MNAVCLPVLLFALSAPPGVPLGCVRIDSDEPGTAAAAVCIAHKEGFAYLLTASHAVPKGGGRTFEFFSPQSYPKPERTVIGGEILLRNEEADFALVKVKVQEPVSVRSLAGAGQRPKRFPASAMSIGCPGGKSPTFRAEKIVGKTLVRKESGIAFYWEIAERPVGGMSGGPLLDAEGNVIGICSAAQGSRGYFTHHDEILAMLKKAGYGWIVSHSSAVPNVKSR